MVSATFKLRHDSEVMTVEITKEFQVPVIPREGEAVFWGTQEAGDYFNAEHVWHHPSKGTVSVEFHCELWVLREVWRADEGWKFIEGPEKKFLRYLVHPEEFEKE